MITAPIFPSISQTMTETDINVNIFGAVTPINLGGNVFAVHMVENLSHFSEIFTVARNDALSGLAKFFVSKMNGQVFCLKNEQHFYFRWFPGLHGSLRQRR